MTTIPAPRDTPDQPRLVRSRTSERKRLTQTGTPARHPHAHSTNVTGKIHVAPCTLTRAAATAGLRSKSPTTSTVPTRAASAPPRPTQASQSPSYSNRRVVRSAGRGGAWASRGFTARDHQAGHAPRLNPPRATVPRVLKCTRRAEYGRKPPYRALRAAATWRATAFCVLTDGRRTIRSGNVRDVMVSSK